MPLSSRIQGPLFRFHADKFFHEGEAFPKSFEDHPKKWDAKERYARENLVCGHFFSLNEAGVEAEAKHYGITMNGRFLLELEVDLDNVLDLIWEPNIREVITFPKTGDARGLTMGSPSELPPSQLAEANIEIKKK